MSSYGSEKNDCLPGENPPFGEEGRNPYDITSSATSLLYVRVMNDVPVLTCGIMAGIDPKHKVHQQRTEMLFLSPCSTAKPLVDISHC